MPITNEIIARRVGKVGQQMAERGLDALVVFSAPTDLGLATSTSGHIRYLSDHADKYTPSLMVLPQKGEPALVMGHFGKRGAQEKSIWVKDIREEWITPNYGRLAREFLQERGINSGRIGLVGRAEMWAPMYQGLTAEPCPWEFEDADGILAELRIIKEPQEIDLHRTAAKISDNMLYAVMNGARMPGKLGWQLMADLEYEARSMDAEYAAGWLATGPLPDFITVKLSPHNREKIQNGDRVQAGTYVTYEGYWGHGIRMGYKGKASPDLNRYFEAILEVQNAGMRELVPGKPLRAAAKAMEVAVEENCPYERGHDLMRFRPGHGLGLNYSDPLVTDAFPQPEHWSAGPESAHESKLTVQPGMVIELHPNFSVPELGVISIGDMVLVTESGPELLTKIPRELFDI